MKIKINECIKSIDAVIFDKDGTMLDTELLHAKAFALCLKEFGESIPNAEQWYFKNCSGCRADNIIKEIKKVVSEKIDIKAFADCFVAYIDKLIEKDGLIPKIGLMKLLKFLKANNVKIAIASSGTYKSIKFQCEKAGILLSFFDCVVDGFDVKEAKPHPEIYEVACRKLGVHPSRAIAIEDSDLGIKSAYHAGVIPILVPDVSQNSDEIKKLAFCTLTTLEQLIPMLDNKNCIKQNY